MIIIPFEPWHFNHLIMPDKEKENIDVLIKNCDLNKIVELYANNSKAFTAMDSSGIIAIAGVLTTGLCWMHTSIHMNKVQLHVAKKCKQMLSTEFNNHKKITAHVDAKYPVNVHFIKWLGFNFAGFYTDEVLNKSFVVYERLNT